MKRVATVAVMNGTKLLMGKRRDNDKWTTPGGHLEAGEDFLDGAVRELEEEAGVKASKYVFEALSDPKTITKPDGEKIKVQPFLYKARWKPNTSMKEDPDAEVHRWHWIDIGDGLPENVGEELHVPLKGNVLFKAMGLCGGAEMKECGPNLKKYAKKHGLEAKFAAEDDDAEAKGQKSFMKQGHKGTKAPASAKKPAKAL